MFESWTATRRIELAKEKMERVLDHFLYVLELNASNDFIVYSKILSTQVRSSYAANAFNVFRQGMHQIEIVRLCALWDGVGIDKENITTVIELVDNDEVIETLAEETRRAHLTGSGIGLINPSGDHALAAIEQDAIKHNQIQFANEEASKAKTELREAITAARAISGSPLLASVMNLRDKHLAHSLTITKREKRAAVEPMKYGYEVTLLNNSIPIVERLFCWVNGKSFSIENSQEIDQENAEALWGGCKFEVLR
jgi:hypothetical protein